MQTKISIYELYKGIAYFILLNYVNIFDDIVDCVWSIGLVLARPNLEKDN